MEREGSTIQSAFKTGFLILIFEFIGTMALTVFYRMIPGVTFIFGFFFLVVL